MKIPDLQLVLLPVDNHSRDLLIHEYQDGDQQGGKSRGQVNPPGVSSEGGHKPAPVGTRWLGWRRNGNAGQQHVDALTRVKISP